MAYPKTLIGKVAVKNNLRNSWYSIKNNTKENSRGFSSETIKSFESNLENNLSQLRKELIEGKHQFGNYRAVIIQKPKGGKRLISIADIRDRVAQKAVASVLERELGKIYKINNKVSFAYQKNKGVRSAISQMLQYHQLGNNILFEADIVKFFDNVNNSYLLNELIFPKLRDSSINQLISNIFNIEIGNKEDLPDEDWELFPDSTTGLPQGGYLSPLLSNIYLSEFDQGMINAKNNLIRYADDFIVLCQNYKEAEQAYTLSKEIIEKRLGLELHPRNDDDKNSKTRIVRVNNKSITFLGIKFNGKTITPDSKKRGHFSRTLNSISHKNGAISLLISTRMLLEGWVSAYGFTDINNNYQVKIDNEVNKVLWKKLKMLDWSLIPRGQLSELQRSNSGIDPINKIINNYRTKLNDYTLFSKYWTP